MLWQGVLFITAFVFSDLIDGAMARKIGRTDDFGAFLDSTLDRIADGALFAGLALYFAWRRESHLYPCCAWSSWSWASVTSYARAKADHLALRRQGRHRRAPGPPRGLSSCRPSSPTLLDLPGPAPGRPVGRWPWRRPSPSRSASGSYAARPSPGPPPSA